MHAAQHSTLVQAAPPAAATRPVNAGAPVRLASAGATVPVSVFQRVMRGSPKLSCSTRLPSGRPPGCWHTCGRGGRGGCRGPEGQGNSSETWCSRISAAADSGRHWGGRRSAARRGGNTQPTLAVTLPPSAARCDSKKSAQLQRTPVQASVQGSLAGCQLASSSPPAAVSPSLKASRAALSPGTTSAAAGRGAASSTARASAGSSAASRTLHRCAILSILLCELDAWLAACSPIGLQGGGGGGGGFVRTPTRPGPCGSHSGRRLGGSGASPRWESRVVLLRNMLRQHALPGLSSGIASVPTHPPASVAGRPNLRVCSVHAVPLRAAETPQHICLRRGTVPGPGRVSRAMPAHPPHPTAHRAV